MRYFLLGLPLIALPTLGLASSPQCADSSTQADLSSCMSRVVGEERQALQAASASYLATLSPADKALFKQAQDAWQTYTDATCRFSSAPLAGGSMQGVDTAQCVTFMLSQRRAQLELQFECEKSAQRTDCLTKSAGGAIAATPSGKASESKATPDDIDRLTTYGAALGKGIACKADGVKEASKRVGQWMDKTFPPGSDDQKTYLPALTAGIEATTRLQVEKPTESCESVRKAFASFPWP